MRAKLRLRDKSLADILKKIRGFGEKVTSLSIVGFLGTEDTEKVITILKALHQNQNLVSLEISSNQLHYKPPKELVAILLALPKSITSLNLGWNCFINIASEDLVAILHANPEALESLDLSGNELGYRSIDELITILEALPKSLISLNLSDNDFCTGKLRQKSTEEIIAILRTLSTLLENLKSLDMSWNDLGRKKMDELVTILGALPKTLTSFGLMGFDIREKSDDELIEIFEAFRGTAITEVNIDETIASRSSVMLFLNAILLENHNNAQKNSNLFASLFSKGKQFGLFDKIKDDSYATSEPAPSTNHQASGLNA